MRVAETLQMGSSFQINKWRDRNLRSFFPQIDNNHFAAVTVCC